MFIYNIYQFSSFPIQKNTGYQTAKTGWLIFLAKSNCLFVTIIRNIQVHCVNKMYRSSYDSRWHISKDCGL